MITKEEAIALIRKAYDSGQGALLCIRVNDDTSIVDATGTPEQLARMIVSATDHTVSKLPGDYREAFCSTLEEAMKIIRRRHVR